MTGLPVLDPPAPVRGRRQYADVLVPETQADLPPGGTLGSVVAAPDGDLQGATPQQALRSRVTRMISNQEDAYAHLRGWGGAPKIKGLARPADIDRLRLQTIRMLKQDPDIVDANLRITQAPKGVRRAFLYEVEIRDRFGNLDSFLTTGEG